MLWLKRRRVERDIRDYIERELDRTIRARHPNLTVADGYWLAEASERKGRKPLVWTIQDTSAPWQSDYVIEARIDSGELLIWFGFTSVGPAATHDLVCPAVHLSLAGLEFMAEHYGSDKFTLGAVLEFMLQTADHRAQPTFPMNHRTLT